MKKENLISRTLRLNPHTMKEIEKLAQKDHRSLNNMINMILANFIIKEEEIKKTTKKSIASIINTLKDE
tara:strand:+ start:905 stop:1111 length:207 start_codon:yes stop_codon:yes gene_type:complete